MQIEKLGEKDGRTHYNCSVCGTSWTVAGKHERPPSCPYYPWHEDATETSQSEMSSDQVRGSALDGGIYDQWLWMFKDLPILLLEFVGMLGLAALFAFLAFAKRVLKPTADFETEPEDS